MSKYSVPSRKWSCICLIHLLQANILVVSTLSAMKWTRTALPALLTYVNKFRILYILSMVYTATGWPTSKKVVKSRIHCRHTCNLVNPAKALAGIFLNWLSSKKSVRRCIWFRNNWGGRCLSLLVDKYISSTFFMSSNIPRGRVSKLVADIVK